MGAAGIQTMHEHQVVWLAPNGVPLISSVLHRFVAIFWASHNCEQAELNANRRVNEERQNGESVAKTYTRVGFMSEQPSPDGEICGATQY